MSEDDKADRVYRGGGWDYGPAFARVAFGIRVGPGYRGDFLGVRLVRIVNPLQQLAEVNIEKD